MSFPAFLVLATFITGIIWGLDRLFFAAKRLPPVDTPTAKPAKEPYIVELSRSFFPVILIVLVIRSFIIEPFRIPSGSMMPTLLVGDFILVNKFSYGLRLPVINSLFLDLGKPQRGDVVVFRYPENPEIDYIKRVVGVPGDRIAYYNKTLYINGIKAEQKIIGGYIGYGGGSVMTGSSERIENLLGVEHSILVMDNGSEMSFEFEVPEDEYFAMGDNRDNSRDSRYWGTVPDENLVGKAFAIWMNWDVAAPHYIEWGRLGKGIN